MNAAVEWVKSNVITVVFIVIVIAALVVIPLFAGRMNESVRQDVEERLTALTQLQSLERTPVEIGTESRQMLVNPSILEQVRKLTEAEREDADRIRQISVEHNRKERGVLNEELLPSPPPHRREVLPEQFHAEVIAANRELLQTLDPGLPPSLESMKEELETKRAQFIAIELKKELSETLTDEEMELLQNDLRAARMAKYAEAAAAIGIYATEAALNLPVWDRTRDYSMPELFEWQWQYWIHQDIINAIADANADSESVLTAPVKRILNIAVAPIDTAGSSGGSSGAPAGGMSGGFSGGAAGARGGADTAVSATPPDPARPVPLDFGRSFTGRVTNPLYDVRYVQLDLDVATDRLPDVLDALARQNFITVINMAIAPVDPFEVAESGYLYEGAVSRVSLQLETIWLRDWTAQFMPPEVKRMLGVYAPPEEPMG